MFPKLVDEFSCRGVRCRSAFGSNWNHEQGTIRTTQKRQLWAQQDLDLQASILLAVRCVGFIEVIGPRGCAAVEKDVWINVSTVWPGQRAIFHAYRAKQICLTSNRLEDGALQIRCQVYVASRSVGENHSDQEARQWLDTLRAN
jgi:hypothetical protein